jgi:dTMP kinase
VGRERPYPGYLVSFEGPEQVGRREALAFARSAIQSRGRQVTVSPSLSATLAGRIYRSAAPLNELSPRTLVLVTATDVAERLEWEILPALKAGRVVLADRYLMHTMQGLARDLDLDWLDVLTSSCPTPDLVFHFRGDPKALSEKLDTTTLDLYEAGMDIGLTRDVPFSYQLYQERLLAEFDDWTRSRELNVVTPSSIDEIAERIEGMLGIEPGRPDVRHHGVMALLHEHELEVSHEVHLAHLARELYDQLAHRHGYGRRVASLLEFGMLLHNAGNWYGDERDRPVRTATTIRDSNLQGFTTEELRAIGVVAAAGSIGHPSELDAWMDTVPEELRDPIRMVVPIARMAYGMDVTRMQAVRWVEVIEHDPGKLLVRLQTRTKARDEVRAVRDRARLLERIYDVTVEVVAERQGPPPASANLTPRSVENDADR